MSLLGRFSTTIRSLMPFKLSEAQAALLSQIDTHKIYVENVRSLLDITHAEAVRILETAVRQGVFEKRVEVLCPDGTVAASADNEDSLPPHVNCWVEDEDGHLEEADIPTKGLKRVVFYSVDERSVPYSRTA